MVKKSSVNDELITLAWARMIECMAHDITTPLSIVRMSSNFLKEHMEVLLLGYRLAVENNLIKSSIDERHLVRIEDRASIISDEITDVFDFLSLVYTLNQTLLGTKNQATPVAVHEFLNEILDSYEYKDEASRSLIHIEKIIPVMFCGDRLFLGQLFSNLLDNAISSINQAGHGDIKIWTEEKDNNIILHFKDTGKGIPPEFLPNVFRRFYSKRNEEIVPGLGFCRLALLHNGGNIECSSVHNQYTEFLITFPK